MFRIYISGSMSGRVASQVRSERQDAVKRFAKEGIFGIDPGASETKLWKKGKKSKITFGFPEKIMNAFVDQDKWLIRRCDALLVLTGDTPSDGTWREMCYAEKIEIPVVMIAPRRVAKEMVGWSNIEVLYIVSSLKEAIKLVKSKLVPKYDKHRRFFESAIKNAQNAVIEPKRRKRRKKSQSKKRR